MIEASSTRRWRKSDASWLLMALIVHLGLLLIPLTEPVAEKPHQPLLSVSLQPFVKDQVSVPTETLQEQEAEEMVEPAEAPNTADEQNLPLVDNTVQDAPIEPTMEKPEERPSAALLINSISFIETEEAEADTTLILGRTYSSTTPANWRPGTGTGAARYIENWFEGLALPRSTQIVDRWIANDGRQNVVVNLPNGMTMCGRREASDPLRPMVEQLMMFHSCGGGGKRTFSMARTEPRSRVASSRETSR
jgi:hypothetical protein